MLGAAVHTNHNPSELTLEKFWYTTFPFGPLRVICRAYGTAWVTLSRRSRSASLAAISSYAWGETNWDELTSPRKKGLEGSRGKRFSTVSRMTRS